jgi:mannose-1-phosphate guanylyltransferase/mannose-6-phosphate isomerase
MKVLILAGGSGTRLWPLSRQRYPKQFIKLLGSDYSLFQETFIRSLELADADDIYVLTNIDYKFLVIGAIEELGLDFDENNILIEPEAKNTLPAIYYGVHTVQQKGEDNVIVLPSDHKIKKVDDFIRIVKESLPLAEKGIITFGIKPTEPNTGYGYISPGQADHNGYKVDAFKEKPDIETAKEYVKQGYLWNGGIFMFNTTLFIEEMKKYAPGIVDIFNQFDSVEKIFSEVENISIDYGIMEKTDKVYVVPLDIGWDDLGSFDAFYNTEETDEQNNITKDDHVLINSKNNLIHTEPNKLITTVDVNDLIIIDQRDALLICKKTQSQHVKQIVNELKSRDDLRTMYHVEDYRPWGHYKVLEEEKNCYKIKRITVLPGKKLSYQLHYHRSEHWVVAKGTAVVTIDDVEKIVNYGESVFMKAGQKHRLENPGKIPLEIIEVQLGDYLEEDDIIRFNDEYGRS